MYSKSFAAVAAVLMICAGSGLAQAQSGGVRGRLAACRVDAQTFCQNVEAGRGRRMACLVENKTKLSPECAQAIEARGSRDAGKQASPPSTGAAPAAQSTESNATARDNAPAQLADAKGGRRGRMAACRTDAATFCANAAKGGGELMKCLGENTGKLSPECRASIAQIGAQAQTMRTACKGDRETLCGGVQKGGGAILQCLRSNRDKLTPACGAALSSMPERGPKGRRADASAAAPR